MFFQFSTTATEHDNLQDRSSCPAIAGAIVTFEGKVRNNNHGLTVTFLEYEAYQELAVLEGQKIIDEAINKFGIVQAHCLHRIGVLNVGDCAVWIAAVAPHRDQAFKGCRYIIDEIKKRLPIWKKETYSDGSSQWINCQQEQISNAELRYYQKQLLLPELSLSKQQRLKNSKVLVVGAGGLGCPVLVYLTGAGVGTIGICDFDIVDESNLHRQVLFDTNDIGFFKTEIAKTKLNNLNPFVEILLHTSALTNESSKDIFCNYDLVIDCTDNLTTKLLLNELAIKTNTAIIQASVYQYEGQIHRWIPVSTKTGEQPLGEGQCLGCLWKDGINATMCSETGIMGPGTGVLGSLQAMEAIKFLLDLPSPLADHLMLFDLISLETRLIKSVRQLDCRICGVNKDNYAVVDINCSYEITITKIQQLKNFQLVDTLNIADFENNLDINVNYLLYCHHGVASRSQAQRLRKLGWKNVYSLKTGLNGCVIVKTQLKEKGKLEANLSGAPKI